MAKLTLENGVTIEGTPEEIFEMTAKFGVKEAEEVQAPAKEITHNGVEYTLVNRKAQAGDVVVFTESSSRYVTSGKVYGPLFNVPNNDRLKTYGNDGDRVNVFNGVLGRTEANTLVYEPKVEPLKVGDYAVVSGSSIFGVDLDGKVGTYRGPSENIPSLYARFEVPSEKEYLVTHENLRKATDAEVAEAKAQAEKDAVFTRLGRKPGEYKKGDIIRILRYQNGDKVGTIREITSVYGNNVGLVGGYMADKDAIELVAPVESRVDAI